MIAVRLFARLREQLDCAATELESGSVQNPAEVRAALAERHGGQWAQVLGGEQVIVAVNQEVADWDSPVRDGDEVAFFPPVTGG